MNSVEFRKKCESDSFAKLELESIFKNIKNMHDAQTFDELKTFYDDTDYYRHGLWAYFCGTSDSACMTYCIHLIGVLSKIYMRNVNRISKKRGLKNEKV